MPPPNPACIPNPTEGNPLQQSALNPVNQPTSSELNQNHPFQQSLVAESHHAADFTVIGAQQQSPQQASFNYQRLVHETNETHGQSPQRPEQPQATGNSSDSAACGHGAHATKRDSRGFNVSW